MSFELIAEPSKLITKLFFKAFFANLHLMTNSQTWYIVKRQEGKCEILPSEQVAGEDTSAFVERWGPFDSQPEAIARRVGLIRAGKCQPQ
jgi:hypothetical protein